MRRKMCYRREQRANVKGSRWLSDAAAQPEGAPWQFEHTTRTWVFLCLSLYFLPPPLPFSLPIFLFSFLSLPLSVEVFSLLASLFGWLSVAVTGHSSAQTLLVLETEEGSRSDGETEGAYQLKQLKHTQPAHVAVRREREGERVRSNCSTNSTRGASRRATIGDVWTLKVPLFQAASRCDLCKRRNCDDDKGEVHLPHNYNTCLHAAIFHATA